MQCIERLATVSLAHRLETCKFERHTTIGNVISHLGSSRFVITLANRLRSFRNALAFNEKAGLIIPKISDCSKIYKHH